MFRVYDWASTSLGPLSNWPVCLRSAVELALPSHAQIVMFLGQEFIAVYNDAYAPTIGMKHPRAFGRPAKEGWSELWSDLGPLLQRVYQTGETISAKDRPFYIERYEQPETVFFDISYSPISDDSGHVHGVFCIVNETTERVHFQQTLRESKEQLQALFSQTAGGLIVIDRQGRILMVNPRFREIVGYSEEELLQLTTSQITHPEDDQISTDWRRQMQEDGENRVFEKRYIKKDGTVVWVRNFVSAIRDVAGQVYRFAAFVLDITNEKHAAEIDARLAAIIDSSGDAIISKDLNSTIVSWNAAAERMFGYTAEEAIGKSVLMLIPQRLQDEEINIIARIKAGERVANYETTRMRKDGTLFDVSLTISPVKTRDGRIVGASKIARDITATKEHERRIKLLMREVNHRVKNQYAVMLAMVKETSRRAANPEEFERNVRERILALSRSHDLLVMSKWSGATLDELVREHLKPFGHEEQIALSGPALTLNSRAVQYLGMAFHELGTNSAKYGALSDGAGSVQVNWAIATSAAGGRELRLCWEENVGRNIPPASEKGHRGFGSVVLQRVTPQALGGTAVLVRESAQVRWELRAPIDGVTVEDEQAEEPAISQASFTDPG